MKKNFIKFVLILNVMSSVLLALNINTNIETNTTTNINTNKITQDEMVKLVALFKKRLPLKIDKYIVATNIEYFKNQKKIKFFYKINIDNNLTEKFIKFLKNDKLKKVCKSKNVSFLLNSGYKVDYIYKVGNKEVELLITKEKCDLLNKSNKIDKVNKLLVQKVLDNMKIFREKNEKRYEENKKKKGPGLFTIDSYPDYKKKSIVYEYNFFNDNVFNKIKNEKQKLFLKSILIKEYKPKICKTPSLSKFLNNGGTIIYKYNVFKTNDSPIKEKPLELNIEISGKCN